jgi:hypothetical protein
LLLSLHSNFEALNVILKILRPCLATVSTSLFVLRHLSGALSEIYVSASVLVRHFLVTVPKMYVCYDWAFDGMYIFSVRTFSFPVPWLRIIEGALPVFSVFSIQVIFRSIFGISIVGNFLQTF